MSQARRVNSGTSWLSDLIPAKRFPDASVAQLDRVLGYEPSGRRFESSRMHHLLLHIALEVM